MPDQLLSDEVLYSYRTLAETLWWVLVDASPPNHRIEWLADQVAVQFHEGSELAVRDLARGTDRYSRVMRLVEAHQKKSMASVTANDP